MNSLVHVFKKEKIAVEMAKKTDCKCTSLKDKTYFRLQMSIDNIKTTYDKDSLNIVPEFPLCIILLSLRYYIL